LGTEKETSLNIIIVIIENVYVGYTDERYEVENGSYKIQITENVATKGKIIKTIFNFSEGIHNNFATQNESKLLISQTHAMQPSKTLLPPNG
jgi:sulfur relay (sulfurtransferase) complex TusBCD TusD component (DsrE family)